MPTKAQAKTAIDAATVAIKADIDAILPVGVNIKDGSISFGPSRYSIVLDAEGSPATALAIYSAIDSALTAASRPHRVVRRDRRLSDDNVHKDEPKVVEIIEDFATYIIVNF